MMTSTDKQETMHANRKRHYPAESAPMDQLFSGVRAECISVAFSGACRSLSLVDFAFTIFDTAPFMSAHERAHLHTAAQLLSP